LFTTRPCAGKTPHPAKQTHLTDISNDTAKSAKLEREIKEKNAIIGKLRHDGAAFRDPTSTAFQRGFTRR
jgi:hypothetical protein